MIIKQLIRQTEADEYGLHCLQNVILNIMQYIHNICIENDIEYYIIGGTALGAVRHGGFIPWDDDLDIAMTRKNLQKFINYCRSDKFDSQNFYLQEERKDWCGYFSKVRLLGTRFREGVYDDSIDDSKLGIFVDIFPLDNVPNKKYQQYWWYVCGKLLVAYGQTKRKGYNPKGLSRKISMLVAKCLNIKLLRIFCEKQVEKYNNKETNYIGGHSLVSRFHNTFSPKDIWGKPTPVPFETIELLAPQNIDGFLKFYFGDYMKLPPVESRRGHHLIDIDFGRISR